MTTDDARLQIAAALRASQEDPDQTAILTDSILTIVAEQLKRDRAHAARQSGRAFAGAVAAVWVFIVVVGSGLFLVLAGLNWMAVRHAAPLTFDQSVACVVIGCVVLSVPLAFIFASLMTAETAS